ncbi:hypothetical protein T11_11843 [Trichinella zimbabwensis]|uniref:Uncharacterized protein n=1 Tax=Trichinella zimbabwensis TaxID=268475 RepID=A0A0V1HAD6_9BILA|nr:hypothetical protein T11_11843 [Trichinella zimbabwensis]
MKVQEQLRNLLKRKKIRKKTGRNRCEAATLLASVITLLLLFSKNAELLCNSICFAYPAVKSLEKFLSIRYHTVLAVALMQETR